MHAERGDRAGLDHALAVYEQKARASRQPVAKWGMVRFRTALAMLEGRFGEAEKLAQEALRLGNQVLTHSPSSSTRSRSSRCAAGRDASPKWGRVPRRAWRRRR